MGTDASGARISVRDNGPGLSPAQQQQLFQPFNRLGAEHSGVQGTGLGLVITRHLVESMHGTLHVRSEPGQGACFTVALPLATDAPAVADAPTQPAVPPPAPGRTWQILYVEDDPVNALLMQAVLERVPGVTLHVAGTGATACRVAESQVLDLLMLDMSLPDMDGRDLLRRLRADPRLSAVPAVAVSADAMPDEIQRTLAAGFDAYWTKPLDIDHLPAALQALLSRASPPA